MTFRYENLRYKASSWGVQEIASGVFIWAVPGVATFDNAELDGALYTIELGLDQTAEGIRPISVKIVAAGSGQPVTGTALRAVPVQELTHEAIREMARRGRSESTGDGGTETVLLSPSLTEQERELVRLRGPVRDSLKVAASVYNQAVVLGLPPAKEVERELGLPRTTATKWIKRARDMGLIESPGGGGTDGQHQETT